MLHLFNSYHLSEKEDQSNGKWVVTKIYSIHFSLKIIDDLYNEHSVIYYQAVVAG